jgi:chromosome segregation ATPase
VKITARSCFFLSRGTLEGMSEADELIALKAEIEAERAARASLESQLGEEREEREKSEAKAKKLAMQMEDMYRKLESEGEGYVNKLVLKMLEEKKEKEKMVNAYESEEEALTNSLLMKLTTAERERTESEKELEELKTQIASMNQEREKLAILLEREEEAVANALLSKLRVVTKEKEAAEMALSRHSSRSSSISEANSSVCGEGGSSITGSITSDRNTSLGAMRDDDVRSEFSVASNQASASESESMYDGRNEKQGRLLPPPPITVGGVLPLTIGEE